MRNNKFFIYKLFLACLILFSHSSLYSLERDYYYDGCPIEEDQEPDYIDDDDEEHYLYASNGLCKDCFRMLKRYMNELDVSIIPNLKERQTFYWPHETKCFYCRSNPAFYSGYLHFLHNDGFPFLKRQIDYTKKYPDAQSYWPETSTKAEKISEFTVRALKDLFSNTELKQVWIDRALFDDFITHSLEFDYWEYREDFAYKSLVSSAFRFSDYYVIFKKLGNFSEEQFPKSEVIKIENLLDKILDELAVQFAELYEESIALHPTEEILQEMSFINRLYDADQLKSEKQTSILCPYLTKFVSNRSLSEIKKSKLIKLKSVVELDHEKDRPVFKSSFCQPDWFMAEYFLLNGTTFNDLMLHVKAVEFLNEAIRINPLEANAYVERAHAYFELDRIDLAVEDFKKAKELQNSRPPFKGFCGGIDCYANGENKLMFSKDGVDYSSGFCIGILEGGGVSLVEFVPSTLSCCRGILHGLWSFTCSPVEVSKDIIDSSYLLMEYLETHTAKGILETFVPEIRDLCLNWSNLTDYERGEQVGYIIGKYGVDILAPGVAINGIKKFRHLKRANTMFTIECCVTSQSKRAKLLKQSAKHAVARQVVCDAVKNGKIIPRNANVMPHVMQKKHAWGRLVKLTGNQKEDFLTVRRILEENKILDKQFLRDFFHIPSNDPSSPLRYLRYEKQINGEVVVSAFVKNIETEEVYLIDAWVKTR